MIHYLIFRYFVCLLGYLHLGMEAVAAQFQRRDAPAILNLRLCFFGALHCVFTFIKALYNLKIAKFNSDT